MNRRVKDKIDDITTYLEELQTIKPENLREYKETKTRAACERYFEKIIETVTDTSFIIIKQKKLKMPEDEKNSFNILKEAEIIDKKLCRRLREAKGMRNLLVHQYGRVDDEIVFKAVTEELEEDVKEFIKSLKESN